MSSTRRGWCIAFEGIDRSGKSTQANELVTELGKAGYPVELWRFPDRSTPTGRLLDTYILNPDIPMNSSCLRLLFSALYHMDARYVLSVREQDGDTRDGGNTTDHDRNVHDHAPVTMDP